MMDKSSQFFIISQIPDNLRFISFDNYPQYIIVKPPGVYNFNFSSSFIISNEMQKFNELEKYVQKVRNQKIYTLPLATPYQIFLISEHSSYSRCYYFWALSDDINEPLIRAPFPNIDTCGNVCLGISLDHGYDLPIMKEHLSKIIHIFENYYFNCDLSMNYYSYQREKIYPFYNYKEWVELSEEDPYFCLKTYNYKFTDSCLDEYIRKEFVDNILYRIKNWSMTRYIQFPEVNYANE